MEEAKELMRRTKAYGIIRIPDDFSRKVNRMQQAYVGLYCDMSGLLYYKALLTACTDVSLDMNTELQISGWGIPPCGRMKCLPHLCCTRVWLCSIRRTGLPVS